MTRLVSVRYLTPVFAVVDLDAEKEEDGSYPDSAVVRVQHGDSDVTRLDQADLLAELIKGSVISEAYDEGAIDINDLTPEDHAKAIDVAERTLWPAWEGY